MTEKERQVLEECRRTNDHPNGFRSWKPLGGGGKGSNFQAINLQKRVASLVGQGLLAETVWGYEITVKGREALK